jgi:predicted NodU family carbamoyl transferase
MEVNMVILGIHQGHDSSAAIVIDGKTVAAVAEERLS